ncbi:unnamed protein product [Arctogadus glacialis]
MEMLFRSVDWSLPEEADGNSAQTTMGGRSSLLEPCFHHEVIPRQLASVRLRGSGVVLKGTAGTSAYVFKANSCCDAQPGPLCLATAARITCLYLSDHSSTDSYKVELTRVA